MDYNVGNAEAVDALFTKKRRNPANESVIATSHLWAESYAAAFLPVDLTGTPFEGMERGVVNVRNVVAAYAELNSGLAALIDNNPHEDKGEI